jgi:hypothetical protein
MSCCPLLPGGGIIIKAAVSRTVKGAIPTLQAELLSGAKFFTFWNRVCEKLAGVEDRVRTDLIAALCTPLAPAGWDVKANDRL